MASQTQRPNSPITVIFPLFIITLTLTMLDRAIIPGGSTYFAAFLTTARDSPQRVINNPDFGIGLLQSAFIGGYSIAIIFTGHFVHKYPWKNLILVGLGIWTLGTYGSGIARAFDSFYLLLFSRMATGVSEAALLVVAPPMIQDRGGDMAGRWLSIYLIGSPIGFALGYVYGSAMGGSVFGWQWAFYIESLCGAALYLIFAFCVKDNLNGGILSKQYEAHSLETINEEDQESLGQLQQDPMPSKGFVTELMEEIKACISSEILVYITLAYSTQVAIVVTIGTFGGAFILALQLFDNQNTAAALFGGFAALSGIIGTPIGGYYLDKTLKRRRESISNSNFRDITPLPRYNLELLASILPEVNLQVSLGVLFAWPSSFVSTRVPFLGFLVCAWIPTFASQPGINYAILLAVEPKHRSNAVAFFTLFAHLCGDVPAPILIGLLKDKLAPACNINSEGVFQDEEQCKHEHAGIHETLAVCYLWLSFGILFFELARRSVMRQLKLHYEDGDNPNLQESLLRSKMDPISEESVDSENAGLLGKIKSGT